MKENETENLRAGYVSEDLVEINTELDLIRGEIHDCLTRVGCPRLVSQLDNFYLFMRKKNKNKKKTEALKDLLKLAESYYLSAIQFPVQHAIDTADQIFYTEDYLFARKEQKFIKLYEKLKKMRRKIKNFGGYATLSAKGSTSCGSSEMLHFNDKDKMPKDSTQCKYKNRYDIVMNELKQTISNIRIYEDDEVTVFNVKHTIHEVSPPTPQKLELPLPSHKKWAGIFEKSRSKRTTIKFNPPTLKKGTTPHPSHYNTISKISQDIAKASMPIEYINKRTLKTLREKEKIETEDDKRD